MKKVMFSMALTFALTSIMAQPGSAAKSDISFKDAKIEKAYRDYLLLKDALVASKTDGAKEAAVKLKTSLGSVKNSQDAMNEVTKMAGASTMEEFRKSFALLSNHMTTMVKAAQLSKGVLYLEYCPMANNNTGAYWLSNEKEIKNPYFGDKMLKCGSVKEVIQ